VKKTIALLAVLICFTGCATLDSLKDQLAAILPDQSPPSTNGQTQKTTPLPKQAQGSSITAVKNDSAKRADLDAAHWDIAKLDTAKDADYLTGIEKDVILEMNKVRSDPKKYAELYIQPELKYYNGNNYSKPRQITIVTQEGKKAVEGCITALSKAKGVPILSPELGLSLGAKDHATDQGKTGQTGHNGSDKSTPFTRIQRYGKGYTTAGENLAYGPTTGRDIVVQLLIDDGVPSRGHRTNIMNSGFTQTGVAFGTHPQYRTMCAITYGKDYVSN
jgi:uncharacterized protein YkwD